MEDVVVKIVNRKEHRERVIALLGSMQAKIPLTRRLDYKPLQPVGRYYCGQLRGINNHIRSIRSHLKLNQSAFAHILGVSLTLLCNIERRAQIPNKAFMLIWFEFERQYNESLWSL